MTDASAVACTTFSAVDASADPARLIAALDEQAELPAIQRLRAAAVELLEPRAGHRVLDAGCGTGETTRRLAASVGPGGRVVGIDASATMLAEARRRTTKGTLPVEFFAGDIVGLEAGDGEFDGVYCERVFQHLDDPHAAVAELVRVTRPGGRIVVVDTDWGMHAINGADPALTAGVLTCWAEHVANGRAGRQLPGLFAEAGLVRPTVVAETITSGEPGPSLQPFATMAAVAQHRGVLSSADAAMWLHQLLQAGRRGSFFWAVTLFAVGVRRLVPS
jgi:SAM-dependent methyltransferase